MDIRLSSQISFVRTFIFPYLLSIIFKSLTGEPKDGWYGNEHGPGSLSRYVDVGTCPNAYGSAFHWVEQSAKAVAELGPERALVVYYEALKTNFASELSRINAFLGLPPLSDAKATAITRACSADSMKTSDGGRLSFIVRKGAVGDWTNYLGDEEWSRVDQTFDATLGDVPMAQPLRFFQTKDVHEHMSQMNQEDWGRFWDLAAIK